MDKMKIVIFSDLHYAPEKPINNAPNMERKLTQYAKPLLEKLIDTVNHKIFPDLIINLGDLIQDYNDKDKDIILLDYIWNEFKKFQGKFYSCIGNHDLHSMSSRKEVEKIMGYKHSTFSFDIHQMHIVILGTYVDNDKGTESGGIIKTQFIEKEDLTWLEEDLNNNNLPTIICTHFGIAEDNMKGNWWFENCPKKALLGNRKELKAIFKKHKNILAVFSGHQHWTKHLIEDEISYYVLGSMTENINHDGIPDGVYFIVEFDGKNLKITKEHIRL